MQGKGASRVKRVKRSEGKGVKWSGIFVGDCNHRANSGKRDRDRLSDYIDAWEESKALRILRRTFRKMTPEARTRAFQLKLGEREGEFLRRAANPATE